VTARAEYTAEEWQLLRTTPYAAGMAVTMADGVGVIETLRESVAMVVAQAEGTKRYPDNELIKALLFDRSTDTAPTAAPKKADAADPSRMAEQMRDSAVEDCRRAAALLDERSHAVERSGYLRWVMDTAKAAAVAARSGGLFSRDPIVDGSERAVLEAIAEELGVEVGELATEDVPGAGPEGAGRGMDPPAPDAVTGNPGIPSGPITPE
jgi:hypothetical protein